MNNKEMRTNGSELAALWKSLVVAAWMLLGLFCWGSLAAVVLLGFGMAEPQGPNADFTLLYLMLAIVVLIFIGWVWLTRTVFKKLQAGQSVFWIAGMFTVIGALLLWG